MNNKEKSATSSNIKNHLFKYLKIGSKPGKIPELDGLRGVAILLVLLFHFATFYREYYGSYFNRLFSESIQNLMFNGWLGVDLFFVLSGYLIFKHLISISDTNQKIAFKQYALKRVLRTFPLFYAMLFLLGAGLIPYYHPHAEWTDYLIHLIFLQDYFGNTILIPLWSLATEEKFYLSAPFLWLIFRNTSPKKFTAVILVTVISITVIKSICINNSETTGNYTLFFSQFREPFHYAVVSILIGILVAQLCRINQYKPHPIVVFISISLIVYAMFFNNLYNTSNWQKINVLHLILTTSFSLLMWFAIINSGKKYLKFLTGKSLRFFSILSYALYLTHYAILPLTNKLQRTYVYSEEAWVHASIFFGIYIMLSLIFSLILHYLIEKPFLILKDKI